MTNPTPEPTPGTSVPSKSKATLSLKIIRKDGTVEEITDIPVELTKRTN